jgi:chromate reductase, NAD(P)H dehydrogenase (quinone)
MVRILAISGSLRAASSNTILLNAAAALAPENVEVIVYRGLADIPPFNPDIDNDPGPPAVRDFRVQLRKSSGVVISSPEYAHGVPGVLKNALDWLVRSGELYEKPVALFNTSPRATFAQESLTATLKVMTANCSRRTPSPCHFWARTLMNQSWSRIRTWLARSVLPSWLSRVRLISTIRIVTVDAAEQHADL